MEFVLNVTLGDRGSVRGFHCRIDIDIDNIGVGAGNSDVPLVDCIHLRQEAGFTFLRGANYGDQDDAGLRKGLMCSTDPFFRVFQNGIGSSIGFEIVAAAIPDDEGSPEDGTIWLKKNNWSEVTEPPKALFVTGRGRGRGRR